MLRGAHPQIDPKDINRFSEEPGSPQQADPVECNVISGSKVKKFGGKKTKSKSVRISELPVIQTPLASISSKSLNISNEELKAFCEKEDKRGEKITEEMNRILAT
ncbi:hypothetical protein GLOIN_2v1878018 [Rhizophagus irregularis DAOM 181602=DAOM 197198]|nr:hypothetical protein GLOIN_2v1878018 [Rhizophagus irregularis DAOM 181602=DAOM 197198]